MPFQSDIQNHPRPIVRRPEKIERTRSAHTLSPRGITWVEMSEIGRVRSRPPRSKKRRDMRQSEYWLDFDPYLKGRDRNLYSDHGTGFTSMEHADGVLNAPAPKLDGPLISPE